MEAVGWRFKSINVLWTHFDLQWNFLQKFKSISSRLVIKNGLSRLHNEGPLIIPLFGLRCCINLKPKEDGQSVDTVGWHFNMLMKFEIAGQQKFFQIRRKYSLMVLRFFKNILLFLIFCQKQFYFLNWNFQVINNWFTKHTCAILDALRSLNFFSHVMDLPV